MLYLLLKENLMLNGKSILITGGTGSLGKELTKTILAKWPEVKRLVIYSRDEQKQYQMAQEFSESEFPAIRYFIGDVRDLERLKCAFNGIDYVIHAAAMKHVHIAEYNPDECTKTNIGGSENVIKACFSTSVTKVVAISTDKACSPINVYGASKFISERLFIDANFFSNDSKKKFSVIRLGNLMESAGSVIPFFKIKSKEGYLPISDPSMTRFSISIKDAAKHVLEILLNAWGSEIYVPKSASYKILDLAIAVDEKCEFKIIGAKSFEKIHEELINIHEAKSSFDLGETYVILPNKINWDLKDYLKTFGGVPVEADFNYSSEKNVKWESVKSLKSLMK